jgi:hypothetical protein
VEDLANAIHLDADNYRNWLRIADGGSMPASATDQLGGTRKFTVPNTVFVTVGSMNGLALMATNGARSKVLETLNSKKYDVVYMDYNVAAWTANTLVNKANADTYGFVFFGHGTGPYKKIGFNIVWNVVNWAFGGGEGTGNLEVGGGDFLYASMFANRSLGLLLIEACHAAQGGWEAKASDAAKAAGTVWVTGQTGAALAGFDGGLINAVNNVVGDI